MAPTNNVWKRALRPAVLWHKGRGSEHLRGSEGASMDVSLHQDIERRLAQLERENGQLRWAVVSILIVAGMVLGSELFRV